MASLVSNPGRALIAVALVAAGGARGQERQEFFEASEARRLAAARAVVLGTVEAVDGRVLTVVVGEVWKGDPAPGTRIAIRTEASDRPLPGQRPIEPGVGDEALFFLRPAAAGDGWRTLPIGGAVESFFSARLDQTVAELLAYRDGWLADIDALEPGAADWARNLAGQALAPDGLRLSQAVATPGRLLALGVVAWWASDSRLLVDGAIRSFEEVAARHRAGRAAEVDAFLASVLARRLARLTGAEAPAIEKLMADDSASWLSFPPAPDLFADLDPAGLSLRFVLLAEGPYPALFALQEGGTIETLERFDPDLLGAWPRRVLERSDASGRQLALGLMFVHQLDDLVPLLEQNVGDLFQPMASLPDAMVIFLRARSMTGVARVVEVVADGYERIWGGRGEEMTGAMEVLVRSGVRDRQVLDALNRLYQKLRCVGTRNETGQTILRLVEAHARRLPPAERALVLTVPDARSAAALVAELLDQARTATGPPREGETAMETERRNRLAMGFLWDAAWVRRDDPAFSIEDRLEAARAHLRPPIVPGSPFRLRAPITAVVALPGDEGRLLFGTSAGDLVEVDAASGRVERRWGRRPTDIDDLAAAGGRVLVRTGRSLSLLEPDGAVSCSIEPRDDEGEPDLIRAAVVSRQDGRTVVLTGHRGHLRTWGPDGRPIGRLDPPDGPSLWFEALSSDGLRAAAWAPRERRWLVLRVGPSLEIESTFEQPRPVREATDGGIPRAIRGVAFGPGGRRLVVGAEDGRVHVWEAATGRLVRTVDRSTSPISGLGIAGGSTVYFATEDGRLGRFPLDGDGAVTFLDLGPLDEMAQVVDGGRIVATRRNEWHVLAADGSRPEPSPPTLPAPLVHLFVRGEGLIASGGGTTFGDRVGRFGQGTVVLDARDGTIRQRLEVTTLDVDRAGQRIAGLLDDEIQVVDAASGRSLGRFPFGPPEDRIPFVRPAAVLTADGKRLLRSRAEGGIVETEVDTGRQGMVDGPELPISALVLDDRSGSVAGSTTVDHRGLLALFRSGRTDPLLRGPGLFFQDRNGLAFHPSRPLLALSSGAVVELDPTGARRVDRLGRGLGARVYEERGSEGIRVVAFSPDGRWLATLDGPSRDPWGLPARETLVRVHDVRTWEVAATLGVGDGAFAFCWKADSRSAWIGYADGELRDVLLIGREVR